MQVGTTSQFMMMWCGGQLIETVCRSAVGLQGTFLRSCASDLVLAMPRASYRGASMSLMLQCWVKSVIHNDGSR